ncbi:helix-turn-helix transcriptional regulator [Morganella morganii]|uniref:helix-turn-helix domain-containing protein n=1 Tax=Morganella morganii TaxID=582 RepID=UPI001309744D|nr:helix-turn-helix transcriptional regulator [Morganella morganii]EBQ6151503.1 XRE family transcriptional regulator [Salmonella enterica subsp. enterica serovar Enteritidis]MBT0505900.1 helix-turn-helix transcriptional regulator [Morganella morganii subsp. morganii]MDW7785412.1 helix-turn-helix transcriptional regulator [Morganella morganii]QWM12862.1 helix-turn-helix transcriptional regulator [Morganella morganii subsp. morganii]WOZ90072.1 helix-turn-helix transcriptional regulator [Morganel
MKKIKNSVSASVGLKIKDIRKSAGISGDDLAKKLGLTQQQISRYESGQSLMTIDTVVMIAHVLHVSVNELLSDYLASEYSDIMLLMNHRNTDR